MSSITCDNGCGTFYMNGREYHNISGKSHDGHNPVCIINYSEPESETIVFKLSDDKHYSQNMFIKFDRAIYVPTINSIIIHKLDKDSFLDFCRKNEILL